MVNPLELTRNDAYWAWSEKQYKAFVKLKMKIVEPPILLQADPTKPHILRIDVSGYVPGAVLIQGE